jgi:hypothetical protein
VVLLQELEQAVVALGLVDDLDGLGFLGVGWVEVVGWVG